jgi:DNA modification methylase
MPQFFEHNALDRFPLDDKSVNLVITSPPYFNLRDYQGDPRQIGQEKAPQQYVDKMVAVGQNIWNALNDEGSYYLNIGDTYNTKNKSLWLIPHRVAIAMTDAGWILRNTIIWHKPNNMPCSIKDRLTPAHEYVFHFVKQRKYYYNLDSIRVPHQTIKLERHIDNENLMAKIGKQVSTTKPIGLLDDEERLEQKGYKNTKLAEQDDINIGARGGFAVDGESLENRYSDGGKNPGDVFHDEKVFTREDERRAAKEKGYGRAAARITERLHVVNVTGHPLGKNPGDVQFLNQSTRSIEERASETYMFEGFEVECPHCSSQFTANIDEFYVENPSDVWSIPTYPFPDAHYAVFPPKLVENMIKAGSKAGDTVLDPFSGSGTTAITAERLNRIGIGFDLNYSDVRERRIAKGTTVDLLELGL